MLITIPLSAVGGTTGTYTIPLDVSFSEPYVEWEEWVEHWCGPQCPCRRPWAEIAKAKQKRMWRSRRGRRDW